MIEEQGLRIHSILSQGRRQKFQALFQLHFSLWMGFGCPF